MGIVTRQASRNAVSILLGTLTGAVNTLLVLPKAFEGFEEGWGLLKVLTAYALILSQFLHGGIPNTIVRFLPNITLGQRPAFLGRLFLIPLVGALALCLLVALTGSEGLRLVNPGDADLLAGYLPEFVLLTIALTFFYAVYGYLSAVLKTTLFQFLNEGFLKSWYLLSALGFLLGWFDFSQLLLAYVSGYLIACIALCAYAILKGFRVKPFRTPAWKPFASKEIASYSLFSILDRGAAIVVNNLDIVMIGLMAGLEDVAYYTLAFYIGAVAMLPQKSLLAIANPLASAAVAADDKPLLKDIYRRSSMTQLLTGGMIFMAIWVSVDEMMLLLPEKFSGGKWVVFFIGLSKVFQMATGVSGGILVYSNLYRMNFVLNLALIVVAIASNYVFMHKNLLDLGITGAAMATALTFLLYNLVKVLILQRHFTINPFSREFAWSLALVVLGFPLYFWNLFPELPVVAILVKSGLLVAVLGLIAVRMKLLPDPRSLLKRS